VQTKQDANICAPEVYEYSILAAAIETAGKFASKKGEKGYAFVEYLLKTGADKDFAYARSRAALQTAANKDLYDITVLLLQYGADYTTVPSLMVLEICRRL
jgi:hypothetical protein